MLPRIVPLGRLIVLLCTLVLFHTGFGTEESGDPDASVDGVTVASSEQEARAEWVSLKAKIDYNNDLYYKQGRSEISDAAYDALVERAERLEALFPGLISSVSVEGAPFDDRTDADGSLPHAVPMLSLEKAKSVRGLEAFRTKVIEALGEEAPAFVVEPKIDGMAISVTYSDGVFVRAVTRGDGKTGRDVTERVRAMRVVPDRLGIEGHFPEYVELRGEIYVSWKDFRIFNERERSSERNGFGHPRNMAVGSLSLDDPGVLTDRPLSLVFFGIGEWLPKASKPSGQKELIDRMRSWGLPAIEQLCVSRDWTTLLAAVDDFERRRSEYPVPTDGVVLKLDSGEGQAALGTSEVGPNWAIAFKYPDSGALTRLRSIDWQVGRTGKLTPVAVFDEVLLSGSFVSRASLHNWRKIKELDLRIGDWIWVEKAGEVIPQVVRLDLERRPAGTFAYPIPPDCPSCRLALNASESGALLYCANFVCPERLRVGMLWYASRRVANLKGIGEATVQALWEMGHARCVADFYDLTDKELEAAGVASAQARRSLLAAIDLSREMSAERVLLGLSIPRLGPKACEEIVERFGSLSAIWDRYGHGDARPAAGILDEAIEEALSGFFAIPENRETVRRLLEMGIGRGRELERLDINK